MAEINIMIDVANESLILSDSTSINVSEQEDGYRFELDINGSSAVDVVIDEDELQELRQSTELVVAD